MKKVIPDIILEQYVLGELSGAKMAEIDSLIESDSSIRQRVNDIKISNTEILSEYPPAYICGRITAAIKTVKPAHRTKLINFAPIPALGAVAATILFVFVFPIHVQHPSTSEQFTTGPDHTTGSTSQDIIRTKGSDSYLGIFRKTNSEPEQLKDGSVTHEGDIIQIVYQSRHPYGVILSIDGKGNVTLHYPDSAQSSSKIEINKRMYLEKSYQLDNAPEFERFFFISSDVGVSTDFILTRARSLAKNASNASVNSIAIAGTKETSIIVKKE